MPGERVTVAYVHPNEVSANFHECLQNLVLYDVGAGQHLCHENGKIAVRCGTGGLIQSRNQAVEIFLQGKAAWLLWIDSDMGFAPDSLERLMAVADRKERPIVGGLCFASREYQSDTMGGYRSKPVPTIYQYVDGKGFSPLTYFPRNTLVQCAATGSAFVLIHRSVFQNTKAWYERIPGPTGLFGEDISFCVRAGAAGFPLYVHTGVRTTHHKPQWVSELDFWDRLDAPPADERVAVVVPVMRRPQNAAPFMRSLRASTGLADVYAVTDAEDTATASAWLDEGAQVLVSSRGSTFAQKVNHAALNCDRDWLFLTGDDVRFHPGWWDAALHTARTENASVVGTNDLKNHRTVYGEHGTHLLVSRSYITETGASWDGPGVVCHEGYRHWFVDDEIVAAAKQRRVWAHAGASRVEHLHPIFGDAEFDDVYELGESHAKRDKALFEKRCREHMKAA